MPSPRIAIAQSPTEMESLALLWEHLLKQQSHTVFQKFSWNRLAAQMFGDRMRPYVVSVEADSGAAIIPAAINHHATGQVEFLGENLFDYRDILHAGDVEVLALAWQQLARCEQSIYVAGIEQAAVSVRWMNIPLSEFAPAPVVDRSLIDENAFRLAHSRLGRQMRRLEHKGVHFRRSSGNESASIRRLYQAKREHFGAADDNVFYDQQRCEFMIALAALEGSGCEFFSLADDAGTLIAGLLTFRDELFRRFYTIYFHPQWARYSPGVALLYEVTAMSLREGLTCDYMTGEYPYKMRLANSSRPLFKLALNAQELRDVAERSKWPKAA